MAGRGHPRNFKTPEDLYSFWQQFKQWLIDVEAKRWPQVQYVGRDGERVTDYPVVPLTMEGFYEYCYEHGPGSVKQYFTNIDNLYDKYIPICARIKDEVRNQQIKGGMLGFYNPSITQRLNGLVDKTQTDVTVNREVPLFPDEPRPAKEPKPRKSPKED